MTNHWIDIRNSDYILAMGSNPVKNHPISYKWITKAVENGGTLISVDPCFTATSNKAQIYAPLRSGTDIAFLGGMIKYILDNDLYFKEYVRDYTNAAFLVDPGFKLPGDGDGVFSGLEGIKTEEGYVDAKYDKTTWAYQKDEKGIIKKDKTFKDPHCVYQLLKKHYSRYTPEKVSDITGTPPDKLLAVYSAYAKSGAPDKSGTVLYAMGWTQHTVGVQNIRAMSIIQLLLGNMGMPGGGVNAMRGESNVQGSTDHGLLFHILPGYLKTPRAAQQTFADYNAAYTPKSNDPLSANWWSNYPKYSASILRAFYGPKLSLDESYRYLPKLDTGPDYSWLTVFDQMYQDKFKGFFAWGQNPACSGANSNKTRHAMGKLEWLVNVNLFDNETASFWKGPDMDPAKIKTEVFLLPCAASFEKEGSISNSGRWMQWRYKAASPPGQALPDGDIVNELMSRVKTLYQTQKGVFPDPILKLSWDYGPKNAAGQVKHIEPHLVAREINGYFLEDTTIKDKVYKRGTLVPNFTMLSDTGATSSGNWLYCGSYNEEGNMAERRQKDDPSGIGLYANWAWSWPLNRRILYNRAAVDVNGKPWAPRKRVIEWQAETWKGDVPDGGWPPLAAAGKGRYPFIMQVEGHGSLFGPGMADGPFPEHYEPFESPLGANPLSPQFINPVLVRFDRISPSKNVNRRATNNSGFPIVCTTYRVTEHWQTGVMTRWQPWLAEMEPGLFVEISTELAELKNIRNGEKIMVHSARGSLEAIAMVTVRWQPFTVAGKTVHQVGMPYHYGWSTTAGRKYGAKDKKPEVFTFGDSANLITPNIGDPNTMIPESKAFMVDIVKKA
ncbi:MAG: formate dehydrogenase [Desulfatitalea sp. BRH_c12]|nr:MAG: formate dehydrogenase [Desulfatitalea sp. BRH_c12]